MSANAFALWEALKGISGLFGSKGLEDTLTQQTASTIVPTLDDEAIQAALDTTLYSIDPQYLEKVQKVRAALEPHQRDRWRKVIATLKLTEKFEAFVVSERTAKTNGSNTDQVIDPQTQGQRRRTPPGKQAREETTRTFDRRKRDYEYTAEDPRVQHLVFIGKLVANETDEELGITKAKSYLLSAGMILEKSLASQGAEKVSKATTATLDATYKTAARLALDDLYALINRLPESDEREKLIAQALEWKSKESKRELATLKANRFPKKAIIMATIGIIIILAIIILPIPN